MLNHLLKNKKKCDLIFRKLVDRVIIIFKKCIFLARDSKGRRREEMDGDEGFPVEIELTQCDTPMNTPYESSAMVYFFL